MVVQAATVSFESIKIGDELPSIKKSETQEDIDNYLKLNDAERDTGFNLHSDQELADKGIFAGTVNYGVSTAAFLVEMLQLAFPTRQIMKGTYDVRFLEPIRINDVVTYGGRVLEKREENGKRLVDVEVTGVNQLGQTVAAGKATIPL